jgi:GntR family transcriptional regulator
MSTPKYKIIYDQIVKFILTDVWPVGSNMKSENELIKLFGVSRLTIRNVLNILENEGRILRSRGKATLILDRLLQNKKQTEIKDFAVTLNADYKLIDAEVVKNNFMKKFKNSSSLYYIKRLRRLKNNELYLISRSYIPFDIIGENVNKKIFKDKNLLEVLINQFEVTIDRSDQELSAVTLSNSDADLFKITKGYPAILNTWNMYDKSNKLVLIDQELTVKPLKVTNYYQ